MFMGLNFLISSIRVLVARQSELPDASVKRANKGKLNNVFMP